MGTKQLLCNRHRDLSRKYIIANNVTYEDLMNMSDDKCVSVSKNYFYSLLCKINRKQNIEQEIYDIFEKYLTLDEMFEEVNGYAEMSRHYLMSVKEIKKLINSLNVRVYNNSILKSNIQLEDLNQKHEELEKRYIELQQQSEHKLVKIK